MLEQSKSPAKSVTRVAVLATSEDQRNLLQSLLQQNGLQVAFCDALVMDMLDKLTADRPDVLLVDIAEDNDDEFDIIDAISDQTDIPMLLNDSGAEGIDVSSTGDAWAKKLAQKLVALAGSENKPEDKASSSGDVPYPLSSKHAPVSVISVEPVERTAPMSEGDTDQAEQVEMNIVSDAPAINIVEAKESVGQSPTVKKTAVKADLNVWVLGASLGGPQAVRQFLATISEELPVAFILAQHIGANHINLLAEQLNRVTAFTVIPGKNGHRLRHGEVILTPADKEISFTDDGYLALKPAQPGAIYSPSIDNVMAEVAKIFGERAGTIVFSGMGDDGANGVEAIAEHNGIVWAQDIASCVVSSMPDHARKTGKVSFSATPEKLAQKLYEHYCD